MMPAVERSAIFKTRGPLDPVRDRAVYVPRPELEALRRAAQAPMVDAYYALLGSRQTGKTTLLYQLRARLRPRGYGIAFVDLGVLRNQNEEELYRYISSQILSELSDYVQPNPRRRGAERLPCNSVQFRTFLLDVAIKAATMRLVILVDETESIPERLSDAFFGTIRSVFSSRRKEDEAEFGKYLFIFSGSRELHRLTNGPNSPLNIAERIYLQDLTLAGVRQLVGNFPSVAISAPAGTAQWIYDQTSGHPYLTQKMCSLIEGLHPGVVTPQVVQRAVVQILKSDDHLEKMILLVDADSAARKTIVQILRGKNIRFSRLSPEIARLELIGAIREGDRAAVRNPLYYAALRSHLRLDAPAPENSFLRVLRLLVAIVAFAFFLLNLPFLFNYAKDIYWSPHGVNDRLASAALGADFSIQYDRVLMANSGESATISVNLEGDPTRGPIFVNFLSDQKDLSLDGNSRRILDQPFEQAQFKFSLNQGGLSVLRYNPFNPTTDQRVVTLSFGLLNGGTPIESYTADFLVDYYSAFLLSAVVSLASFLATAGAILSNVGRVQQVFGMASRSGQNSA